MKATSLPVFAMPFYGRMNLMKRLGRIVLNTLTVVSAVLALLVAGSWARSYWRSDSLIVLSRDGRTLRAVLVPKGRVTGLIRHENTPLPRWGVRPGFSHGSGAADDGLIYPQSFAGFGSSHLVAGPPWNSDVAHISIPHWFLLTLFATLPAVRFYRHLRRRRIAQIGHCRQCGYDLRATPDRCPECGTVPGKVKS